MNVGDSKTGQTGLSNRRSGYAVALVICALTASWTLQDVLLRSDCIPTTKNGSATVPLFNLWTIERNLSAFTHATSEYWNAPIFYPVQGTFAFSEPQPMTIALLPVRWLGASPATLYKTYLLISLSLNGFAAFSLLQLLYCGRTSSTAGAVGMTLLPIVHDQLDVLQLVSIWPELWLLCCLLRATRLWNERRREIVVWLSIAVQTSLAIFCCAATCLHHFLFAGIVLFFSAWVLILPAMIEVFRKRHAIEGDSAVIQTRNTLPIGRSLISIVIATMGAAVLLFPWLLPMRSILQSEEFQRSEAVVSQLSAEAADLVHVGSGNLFPFLSPERSRPWFGSPGNVRIGFAILAIPLVVLCVPQSGRCGRTHAFFLLAWTLVAETLSMGNHLQCGDVKLWPILVNWIPGLAQIRSVFRFLYFYQIGILLLASIALDTLSRVRSRSNHGRYILPLLSGVGLCVLAFEVSPSRLKPVSVISDADTVAWIRQVKNLSTPNRSILVLPYARTSEVEDFEQTTRWMVSMVESDLRMVNGYSGFFPRSHYQWQSFLNSKPTSWQLAERMRQHQVDVVVATDPEFQAFLSEPAVGGLMFDEITVPDSSTVRVYRLR